MTTRFGDNCVDKRRQSQLEDLITALGRVNESQLEELKSLREEVKSLREELKSLREDWHDRCNKAKEEEEDEEDEEEDEEEEDDEDEEDEEEEDERHESVMDNPTYIQVDGVEQCEEYRGVDLDFKNDRNDVHPDDEYATDGKSGLLACLTLQEAINICSRMNPRPNVIIKAGPKAKWYFKGPYPRSDIGPLVEQNAKKKWREKDTARRIMYVIVWNDDNN